MDFMKVFDQAVREIKREVNIKVLKIPEIEQKVLDATSNEPWGPHGSALAEIAQATKKFTERQMIMDVLWTRLTETGRNWRYVYKALTVIEYLVANGSERALDDVLEHTFQISSISGFEYVEPNGKDMGINVRKKVETILALLNSKDKIQEVRNKAAANRDKYFGLSSTGITYKSSSASHGSSSFYRDNHYGGLGSAREGETFKDGYKLRYRYGDETDWNHGNRDGFSKDGHGKSQPRSNLSNENEGSNSKKGSACHGRGQDDNHDPIPSSQSSSAPPTNTEDDFDDFNPRASSTAGSTAKKSNQVNLFGESLIGDHMDAPVPTKTTTTNSNALIDIDLFADATFVSASLNVEAHSGSHTQSAFLPASSSSIDFFAAPDSTMPTETDSTLPTETKSTKPESANPNTVDLFATKPVNNFEGSDIFGDFTSHTVSVSTEPPQNSANEGLGISNQNTSTQSKTPVKKDTFQVKSGIWADSLSRGLIDLNITAPKKTSLADIGNVGRLSGGVDEMEKGPPTSVYMGRAMGVGSGIDRSGFTPSPAGVGMGGDGSLSKLGQY
ncbi:clathrin interactor EPSIN 1-like isoform X2 [Magnolia sinica]|uniref:clathrin interactor EPSIN 1-like isoform X2 n=1 Tax=Magnolia sinica TaxID=86752 RepID=UPI00265A404C|nr:clathrin interactor EPSIN 1-like isoform X2 [Magnolia sinica]